MKSPVWALRPACRICGGADLKPVFDFGKTPLSDQLVPLPESHTQAPRVPLELAYCADCHLSQLSVDVAPEDLFGVDYPYYSSVSPALNEHFAQSARDIIAQRQIGAGSVVIEAASNDGYLLRHFKEAGAQVIGYDPAAGPAKVAADLGIDARVSFFGTDVAKDLTRQRVKADVFLANNVLAHVPDLTGFVGAIATVLADDGVAVIEVPYLVNLIEGHEFDTIYHQHYSYFLVSSLSRLFADAGLCLADVKRLSIHGGSLRLFIQHGAEDGPVAKALIAQEAKLGQTTFDYVARIGPAAAEVGIALKAAIDDALQRGKKVRAYAAAGKATTMLSWTGLDQDRLHSVADLNVRKHGLYMPGTDLLIRAPQEVLAENPDVIVILAWNFADEIMRQLRDQHGYAGQFIVPLPEVRVL